MTEEVNTAGWDAIEEEVTKLYGKQEPKHYGTAIPYMLGGQDPLDGLSAYKAEIPFPHWHIITFGFSELYEKESENPDYSGYGFELTFRVARSKDEEEPPAWALNLLQNMGRYVFNSGNIFAAGDYLDANGPICLGADTMLTALAFIPDPELDTLHTANGRVEFLQMVGITEDELEAMKTWNTRDLLEAGKAELPGYITDLSRNSILRVPAVQESVRIGIERDGSSTGFLFVDQLAWDCGKNGLFSKKPSMLTLGAKQADTVGKLLRGRLLKGKNLILSNKEISVTLEPASTTGIEIDENKVHLKLDEAVVNELIDELMPKEGEIRLSSYKDLIIQVVKTYIKDQDGNAVSTIG
ncbi:suppressor of fused domain protein [Paenibacillus lutrae]|uniref:Suppressor of fused domain protein n=1 Tax=Paenibacillus lutrae TaxID=2078573 RepID=A0A7X3FEC5_9BACL|nr:suppressor of fused domain protein [Paenibacillus lutrae]MVO98144.1 suppressor of fused domain protein [Paenibacillus lutrae]